MEMFLQKAHIALGVKTEMLQKMAPRYAGEKQVATRTSVSDGGSFTRFSSGAAPLRLLSSSWLSLRRNLGGRVWNHHLRGAEVRSFVPEVILDFLISSCVDYNWLALKCVLCSCLCLRFHCTFSRRDGTHLLGVCVEEFKPEAGGWGQSCSSRNTTLMRTHLSSLAECFSVCQYTSGFCLKKWMRYAVGLAVSGLRCFLTLPKWRSEASSGGIVSNLLD